MQSDAIEGNSRDATQRRHEDSQAYKATITTMAAWLEREYWAAPLRKLLLSKWNIFVEEDTGATAFNDIYEDVMALIAKESLEENNAMFSTKDRKKLEDLLRQREERDAKRGSKPLRSHAG